MGTEGLSRALARLCDDLGGAVVEPGRGAQGLIDRVAFAGGRLTLDSPAGGPTRIDVRVPLRDGVDAPSSAAS